MRKNLDQSPPLLPALPAVHEGPGSLPVGETRALGRELRQHLQGFLRQLAGGGCTLLRPVPTGVSRSGGHFHLAPELFLQVSGWTRFHFPNGECLLPAGQALLMPPGLLHDERIGTDSAGGPFVNLVLYADGAVLTCHLAHEAEPGRPGIQHLEARRHALAARIHDWLSDAADLSGDPTAGAPAAPGAKPDWSQPQATALVQAALAGVLRLLDDAGAHRPPEPTLIARLRVRIQNQLGDPALSVRGLAEQSGCTADYLSHLFRQCTDEHLVSYINRLRMERAAHLLSHSRMAGKEIAWACGYAAPSYFIRTFKAHFGLTPSAWRAQAETAEALGHTERRLWAPPEVDRR